MRAWNYYDHVVFHALLHSTCLFTLIKAVSSSETPDGSSLCREDTDLPVYWRGIEADPSCRSLSLTSTSSSSSQNGQVPLECAHITLSDPLTTISGGISFEFAKREVTVNEGLDALTKQLRRVLYPNLLSDDTSKDETDGVLGSNLQKDFSSRDGWASPSSQFSRKPSWHIKGGPLSFGNGRPFECPTFHKDRTPKQNEKIVLSGLGEGSEGEVIVGLGSASDAPNIGSDAPSTSIQEDIKKDTVDTAQDTVEIIAVTPTAATAHYDYLITNKENDYLGRFTPLFHRVNRNWYTGNWTLKFHDQNYDQRVAEPRMKCEKNALWDSDIRPQLKCVLDHVGAVFGLTERAKKTCGRVGPIAAAQIGTDTTIDSDTVADAKAVEAAQVQPVKILDWGSGCGHSLAYLASRFQGVYGVGIDASEQTVKYAQETYEAETTNTPHGETGSTTRFCHHNGVDLSYYPSNFFDHALSYAALYHFEEPVVQCDVIGQLLRVIKPKTNTVGTNTGHGGRLYIGWHVVDGAITWRSSSCRFFTECLNLISLKTRGILKGRVLACMPEPCLFGASAYGLPYESVVIEKG